MKLIFDVPDSLGTGGLRFTWNRRGTFLAVAGEERKVVIYNRKGELQDEISIPLEHGSNGKNCIGALDWHSDEDVLAVLPGNGAFGVFTYDVGSRLHTQVNPSVQTAVTSIRWQISSSILAMGTEKGSVIMYNRLTTKLHTIAGVNKNAIISILWCGDVFVAMGGGNEITFMSVDGNKVGIITSKFLLIDMNHSCNFVDQSELSSSSAPASVSWVVAYASGMKGLVLVRLKSERNEIDNGMTQSYSLDEPIVYESSPRIVRAQFISADKYIVSFESGVVRFVSVNGDGTLQTLLENQYHQVGLNNMRLSNDCTRAVTCGQNQIKIIDIPLNDLKNQSAYSVDVHELPHKFNIVDAGWSDDGQIVSATTSNGGLYVYLAALPCIAGMHPTRVAVMSGLTEITVADITSQTDIACVNVAVEPDVIGVGPSHVAVGMNDRAWIYRFGTNVTSLQKREGTSNGESICVNEYEYMGILHSISLNSRFVAALLDGKILLHDIEKPVGSDVGHTRQFPPQGLLLNEENITCSALCENFVIFATSLGRIFYYLADLTPGYGEKAYGMTIGDSGLTISEHEHRSQGGQAITNIFPSANGTRCIFIDDQGFAFLYCPVGDIKLPLENVLADAGFASLHIINVLWDEFADQKTLAHTFVVVGTTHLVTCCYIAISIDGPTCVAFEESLPAVPGYRPIVCYNGVVTCQRSNGTLQNVILPSHKFLQQQYLPQLGVRESVLQDTFEQALKLKRLSTAWDCAQIANNNDMFDVLVRSAMQLLELDMAIRIYRGFGDASLVMTLERINKEDDLKLICGNVCLLFQDFGRAEEYFLHSTKPLEALLMYEDVRMYKDAIRLAERLDPTLLASLSSMYGGDLEIEQAWDQALFQYDSALSHREELVAKQGRGGATLSDKDVEKLDDIFEKSVKGRARCLLRCGDVKEGVSVSKAVGDSKLFEQCAEILETEKHFDEASQLYQLAGNNEAACSIYIKTKNYRACKPLLQNISKAKLHGEYGKAMEAEGDFGEACEAYERAGDTDAVTRLCLTKLNNPTKAFTLVRKSRSSLGAAFAAKYCLANGEVEGAIEFLILSDQKEDAFELARKHDVMDSYARSLEALHSGSSRNAGQSFSNFESGVKSDDYAAIAQYYHSKGVSDLTSVEKAADNYDKAGKYKEAVQLYLTVKRGEEYQCIEKAIESCGSSGDVSLTHYVLDFLTGVMDGEPKDPRFLFTLQMALRNYPQAARTAIIISKQEQDMGNYRVAHAQLRDTWKRLEQFKVRVPQALRDNLLLLHSYVLVKVRVRMGDHYGAAKLLCRVAMNISRFPVHVVPILTSTVIECQRAGLKRESYEWACHLMKPEYRQDIAPQYKKKVEGMVRRPEKNQSAGDTATESAGTPCPYCNSPVREYDTHCSSCMNNLPYCIATGHHMTKADWGHCQHCKFPVLRSALSRLVEAGEACPMCDELNSEDWLSAENALQEMVRPEEISKWLQAYCELPDEDDVR